MTEYAKGTSVSVLKTRVEIEQLLVRFKATSSAVAMEPGSASVMFFAHGRWVKFRMPLPTYSDSPEYDRHGWVASEATRNKWLDQQLRERWRALLLVLKSKFVALDAGVETFEQAFLAHLVGENGMTVGDTMIPRLQALYASSQRPQLGSGAQP